MQMWVKDAASNEFLKLVDRWGGGACPSSRLLTSLTSTQTVLFPMSLLESTDPGEGVMGLGCAWEQSQWPRCTPAGSRGSDRKIWALETVEFTHSRQSCGGESLCH